MLWNGSEYLGSGSEVHVVLLGLIKCYWSVWVESVGCGLDCLDELLVLVVVGLLHCVF